MRVSNAFPSKYLSAEDLGNSMPVVNISHVENEKMADGEYKPCLFFVGKQKGLVLNKTNAMAIAQLYGDEMDEWTGKSIQLFSIRTEFQGKPVMGVRVQAPKSAAPQSAPSQQHDERNPPDPLDDEIGF